MRRFLLLLLAGLVSGCNGPRHVSPAEFQRQYRWVDQPQTMHDVDYLGQRDGQAFIRVSSMSTVSQKWSDEIICVELNELDPEFRDTLPEAEFAE